MLSFDETHSVVSSVRRRLRKYGYDTASVDVTIARFKTVSQCVSDDAISIELATLFTTRESCKDDLIHEFGHALLFQQWDVWTRSIQEEFIRLFGHPDDDQEAFWLPTIIDWISDASTDTHVSQYATTSPHEDFAETFVEYFRYGKYLPNDDTLVCQKLQFVDRVLARL